MVRQKNEREREKERKRVKESGGGGDVGGKSRGLLTWCDGACACK